MAIEFAPQCCDAVDYLTIGADCAATGNCYNALRPMGAIYWFALPSLLSLPQQYIIYIHWFLLICSVALSTKLVGLFLARERSISKTISPAISFVGLFLSSLAIHLAFFIPIINNSLADVPAGFFSLFSIWFLFLSAMRDKGSIFFVFLAGLFLGLAAWVRVFYLYPLLVTLLAALLIWIFRPKEKLYLLTILVALIPLVFQAYNTYNQYGYIAYLSRDQAGQWTTIHLNDPSMGYDTWLPPRGERWPSKCGNPNGPIDSLKNGNVLEAACVYLKKLQFYFGSYAQDTYLQQAVTPVPGGDSVHAQGSELEKTPSGQKRSWSKLFLILNLAAVFLTFKLLLKARHILSADAFLPVLFVVLSLGQSLLIIPEQRFVVIIQVSLWILAFAELVLTCRFQRKTSSFSK